MIPKPLNEIEWADLESLRDSKREEDDTLEFKASFSGGSDYLKFTDSERERAVKGIAREAIAFLNGRGGDVVIGAVEESNVAPRIGSFQLVPNATAVADRLAQTLSAVIEPYQSIVGVRAIQRGENGEGVIVIRAPQSLRAPHRLMRDKECYIRRGRESVPMPMDEIQDAAVQRNLTRSERSQALEALFIGHEQGIVRRETATGSRVHARIAFLPIAKHTFDLDDHILNDVVRGPVVMNDGTSTINFNDLFLRVNHFWTPVLRGKAQLNYHNGDDLMELVGREFRTSGAVIYDVAWRLSHNLQGSDTQPIVPMPWLIEFVSTALWEIRAFARTRQTALPAMLELRSFAFGPIKFGMDRQGRDLAPLLDGTMRTEPFEINRIDDFDFALAQMQRDLYALVERAPPYILAF